MECRVYDRENHDGTHRKHVNLDKLEIHQSKENLIYGF